MVIKMKKYIGGIIVIFTVCLLTIIDSKRSQIVKEDVAERNKEKYGDIAQVILVYEKELPGGNVTGI